MTQAKASETKPRKESGRAGQCTARRTIGVQSVQCRRKCHFSGPHSFGPRPQPTPPEPPIPATPKTPPPVLSEAEVGREARGLLAYKHHAFDPDGSAARFLVARIAALAAERQKEADAKVADYLAAKLKRDANATSAACEGEPSGMQAACELDACAHALTAFAKELRGGSR